MLASLMLLLATATPSPTLPACRADQLSLGIDDEGGAFDGMSHSGGLLVLRNLGTAACTVPGLPTVTFRDAQGKPLAIVRRAPPGMHPGPVVRPVGIAAGAEATTPLRWVSGPVYDKSRCFDPHSIAVAIGGATVASAASAHICAAAGTPATFDQPPLRTDPVL